MRVSIAMGVITPIASNSWMVYFRETPGMDDDWGYPYDSGNLHMGT